MKAVSVSSPAKTRAPLVALMIFIVLVLVAIGAFALLGRNTSANVLTQDLSQPLDGATSAKIEINPGDGNLKVDTLTGGEPLLAGGTLQYLENQALPAADSVSFNGQTTLSLKSGGGSSQSWFRLPWEACNGATEWQIHLNPGVPSELTTHSDGGNISLNLAGMALTGLSADTGGGNIEVVLPQASSSYAVSAKTGAGNVVIRLPAGSAARIHVSTGLGQVIVDSSFTKIDEKTYQSPDYDTASNRVELTLSSGAGNVEIILK